MNAFAPPRGSTAKVGEYDIHYLSYGEGPAVVFLHGSGLGASAYSNFKQNIDAVVNCGHRAVLIDMIGFGYSSKPADLDYTMKLFVTTVKAALDTIGIDRCSLVGNSLGGGVSIRLALDHPEMVQRLILMAPGAIEERETYFAMPGIAKMVSAFVEGPVSREGLRTVLESLVFHPKHITDELVEERFCILETQPKEVLLRMVIPSMGEQLSKLQCPVFGFWGQQDQMTPVSGATKFLNQVSECEFQIFSDCGHWVMVEYAERFNLALGIILTGA
ncbi:alpha/beta fold hydrolase [Microbulbifer spongiae]|uniref:Alpha/beta fold hydrolase n=1 Tax=Microbulbifer spongiae TaxID=2944933 RepID=A0ABY9EAE9_9GAMM|nr:alpha/beta fold hydrolase [Microbulbifer sp. MI-G]WKD49068.1 alpha/beta fold hydrolase [Microbulbifer sp. MI-G]